MCRSDAPRSTAALMIFSISVPGLFVDDIPQGLALEYRRQLSRNRSSCRGQNRPGDTGDTCGVSRTCRSCHSGLVAASGSSRNTSSTAPREPSVPQAFDERRLRRASRRAPRSRRSRCAAAGRDARPSAGRRFRPSAARRERRRRGSASSASSSSSDTTRSNPGGGPSSDSPTDAGTPRAQARVSRSPPRRPIPPTPTISARTVSISRSTESTRTNGVLFHSVRRCWSIAIVESAQKMQHAGDDVLGDRYGVNARRVRE